MRFENVANFISRTLKMEKLSELYVPLGNLSLTLPSIGQLLVGYSGTDVFGKCAG